MGEFMDRRYKSIYTLAKIKEICGWILVITLIGIPWGISMILDAQMVLVFIDTENNTRRSVDELKRVATAIGPSGVSRALMSAAKTPGGLTQAPASNESVIAENQRGPVHSEPTTTAPVVTNGQQGKTCRICGTVDTYGNTACVSCGSAFPSST